MECVHVIPANINIEHSEGVHNHVGRRNEARNKFEKIITALISTASSKWKMDVVHT